MKTFKEFVTENAKWHIKHPDDSEVLHHGSTGTSDIKEFRPFSHFGTKHAARARLAGMSRDPNAKHSIYSVRLRLGKTVHVSDVEEVHDPIHVANVLHLAGHISNEEHLHMHQTFGMKDDETDYNHLRQVLKQKGINSVSYTNSLEDAGSKSYMITDPKQVRVLRKSDANINIGRGKKRTNSSGKNVVTSFHHNTLLATYKEPK